MLFFIENFVDYVGSNAGAIILILTAIYVLYEWIKPRGKMPPGPIGLPLVGYIPFLGQQPHKVFVELSKKYGGMFSLKLGNKLAVVVNEHNVFKEAVCHSSVLDRPPDFFPHLPEKGFFISNGEDWIEQRRFCIQATKDIGMGRTQWEKCLDDEVIDVLDELSSFKGQPVYIRDLIVRATSVLMMSLIIGRRLDKVKEHEKIDMITKFMHFSMANSGLSNPVTMLPFLRIVFEKLKFRDYHKTATLIKEFSSFIEQEISIRKNNLEHKDTMDFLTIYLNKLKEMEKRNTKHYFSEANLRGHVNVLFLGGSDTSAMSLEYLFRIMASRSDIQDKVHNELDEVFGIDGNVSYSLKDSVPYIMAVIMEGQRLSNLIPLSPLRLTSADVTINGYIIPKGTPIIPNIYGVHRDEKYWPEPDKFKPERFLTPDGRITKNLPSYFPFSTGKRSCPGENVAWKEVFLIFTSVLQKFQINPPEGAQVSFELVNGLVTQLKPQQLCFRKRWENECGLKQ